jgi:hypothetical protein
METITGSRGREIATDIHRRDAETQRRLKDEMKLQIEDSIEVLQRTPSVVRAMLGGLSEEWTGGGDESNWAPFDIVGHLIHGEVTDWIPRAEIILHQGEDRTFEPFDRLAQFELSKGKSLEGLLGDFETKRLESLDTLRSWNLADEQLGLKGIHPEFGDVSLSELIAAWVAHDLTHIRQITQFLAKKYADEVGPWREYLSILDS